MPLPQPTSLQLSFSGGIDESTRPELIEPGTAWRTLENLRQVSPGSVSKRWGFTALALTRLDATARSAGYRLFSHGKQTCVIDGSTLDSYSTSTSVSVSRGRVPECGVEYMPLPNTGFTNSKILDTCLCGSYFVILYRVTSGTTLYAAVVDTATGTVVKGPESLFSGTGDHFGALATYGTRVFAFSIDSAGAGPANLTYRIINTASASTINTGWSVSANAATDARTTTPALSACSLSNRVAVAYGNNSGGASRLTVKTLDSTGVLETATVNTGGVTPVATAVEGSIADTLWVAWNETTSIKVVGLDADALAVTLATVATLITTANTPTLSGEIDVMSSTTAGAGRVFANDSTGTRMYAQSFITSAGAVTSSGAQALVYNTLRSSRVFKYSGRYYALCRHTSEPYAIVCDLSESTTYVRPIANLIPQGLATAVAHETRVEVSGTTAWVALAEASAQENFYGLKVAKLDFASLQRWQTAAHAGKTFLSGALLSVFDGMNVTECGFLIQPPKPTTSLGGTGITGTYRYAVTYDYVDKSGTWHVSSVSDPSAAATPSNETVTVTVRPLAISARITATTDPSIRISIYRTATGGEPPYYYLSSIDNALTAATLTYADATTDANLTGNEKLYAPSLPGVNGGAQDRRAPPGLMHVVSYNGMLVGARGEDVWHSGQDVVGEGTWFNPLFQVPVSGDGDITALATQDGTLFVFKRQAIYAIAGEPPSDNGAAGGLGAPRRLAVDTGAAQRPTCVTSLGIFFVSDRGLECLTRAQTVEYCGEKVKETFAAYPVVMSMTFDPDSSCIFIELAASTSSGVVSGSGRTLVFDTRTRVWQSIDRRTNTAGTSDAPAQDAALVWSGSAWRYAWLGSEGRVYVEDHTTYLDPGSAWVTQRADSPKMRMAGIQSNHKLLSSVLLAERATNHQTRINVAYDDSSTWTDSETWTATETAALTREQLEIDCSLEQVMSVQIRVEDLVPSNTTATPVTTGEGAAWIGLALNIGANNTRQATTLLPEAHRK